MSFAQANEVARESGVIQHQARNRLRQAERIGERLERLLNGLRYASPQPVGPDGSRGAVETTPPLAGVLDRLENAQDRCDGLLGEIESLLAN